MKKLLILMLVLGLVSTAGATPKELWVAPAGGGDTSNVVPDESAYVDAGDTTITLDVGKYLWIGIYNAEAGSEDTGQEVMYLAFVDTATPANGEWTGNYYMDYMTDYPTEWANVYRGPRAIGDTWKAALSSPTLWFVPVGIMDAKEFKCLASSDVTVTLWDEAWATPYDSFVIHQVPEPMTLALLGLGGLLLRRRK